MKICWNHRDGTMGRTLSLAAAHLGSILSIPWGWFLTREAGIWACLNIARYAPNIKTRIGENMKLPKHLKVVKYSWNFTLQIKNVCLFFKTLLKECKCICTVAHCEEITLHLGSKKNSPAEIKKKLGWKKCEKWMGIWSSYIFVFIIESTQYYKVITVYWAFNK